ncbi:MAG: hypothetical protein JW882_15870 [Deltaproteobacteria bacterium]|nr:hypothetical protein [Deltaproteobacteria bacterium]
MAERERFTTTIDSELLQKIKILAIYEKCSANDLMEEAIQDLLQKYEEKKAQGKGGSEQGDLFHQDIVKKE